MDALRGLGINEVIVFCVNDGAVMDAWAENQGVDQTSQGLITMFGDPTGGLTRALGMELTHPGPMRKLGYPRSKRFAMYVRDGVIEIVRVSEAEDDPAGDDRPEETLAPAMIAAIKQLKSEKSEL